jgi:hypothetical protein
LQPTWQLFVYVKIIINISANGLFFQITLKIPIDTSAQVFEKSASFLLKGLCVSSPVNLSLPQRNIKLKATHFEQKLVPVFKIVWLGRIQSCAQYRDVITQWSTQIILLLVPLVGLLCEHKGVLVQEIAIHHIPV